MGVKREERESDGKGRRRGKRRVGEGEERREKVEKRRAYTNCNVYIYKISRSDSRKRSLTGVEGRRRGKG